MLTVNKLTAASENTKNSALLATGGPILSSTLTHIGGGLVIGHNAFKVGYNENLRASRDFGVGTTGEQAMTIHKRIPFMSSTPFSTSKVQDGQEMLLYISKAPNNKIPSVPLLILSDPYDIRHYDATITRYSAPPDTATENYKEGIVHYSTGYIDGFLSSLGTYTVKADIVPGMRGSGIFVQVDANNDGTKENYTVGTMFTNYYGYSFSGSLDQTNSGPTPYEQLAETLKSINFDFNKLPRYTLMSGFDKDSRSHEVQGTHFNENVYGGSWHDKLYAQGGNDYVYGNNGNDLLDGGDGNDVLDGGQDNDQLQGGNGNDWLYGRDGNDKLFGGYGNDRLYADNGNDWLYGGLGDDILDGGSGNDVLNGENDNDRLYGRDGNDRLYANNGKDKLYGGNGNDWLYGGLGDDILDGGSGNDVLNGENDNDRLYGRDGNDRLYANNGKDKLYGGNGNDILDGGSDNDVLSGENDNDRLYGRDGNDRLYGGNGNDQLNGGNGKDRLYGGHGNDILDSGADNDLLYGQIGNDRLISGPGNDRVYGDKGNDWVYGGNDNDIVVGGDGNDRLYGQYGNDIVQGGSDNDWVDGGPNNDRLWGGSGADYFCFDKSSGADYIHDFQNNLDKVRMQGVSANDLTFTQYKNQAYITWGNDNSVLFINVAPGLITTDDFVFV